jgi:hypothetical protein
MLSQLGTGLCFRAAILLAAVSALCFVDAMAKVIWESKAGNISADLQTAKAPHQPPPMPHFWL